MPSRLARSGSAFGIHGLEISPERIGDVIGPGGKIIKKIQADTGAKIDIEQSGKVYIACADAEGGERARKMIEDLTKEVSIGETYQGRVTRLMDFGAFVELEPGVEGLIHISELARNKVWRVTDVVKPGQEVEIKVLSVDPGARRISLSLRAALVEEPVKTEEEEEERALP